MILFMIYDAMRECSYESAECAIIFRVDVRVIFAATLPRHTATFL